MADADSPIADAGSSIVVASGNALVPALEEQLKILEQKLEALQEMPQQLLALQELPKQLSAMAKQLEALSSSTTGHQPEGMPRQVSNELYTSEVSNVPILPASPSSPELNPRALPHHAHTQLAISTPHDPPAAMHFANRQTLPVQPANGHGLPISRGGSEHVPPQSYLGRRRASTVGSMHNIRGSTMPFAGLGGAGGHLMNDSPQLVPMMEDEQSSYSRNGSVLSALPMGGDWKQVDSDSAGISTEFFNGGLPRPSSSLNKKEQFDSEGSSGTSKDGDIDECCSGDGLGIDTFPSLMNAGGTLKSSPTTRLSTGLRGARGRDDYVLDPDSKLRLVWDAVLIVNIVCAGILIPLLLVYFDLQTAAPHAVTAVMLFGIDLIWPIDVVLNFRTGFLVRGELVVSSKEIAGHYAKGWLLPDLLGLWPLFYTNQGGPAYVLACLFKGLRLLQLLPRFSRIRAAYGGTAMIPISIATLSILAVHMMSCVWRASLRADSLPLDAMDDVFVKYMSDVYFVTMTLTSVGYGDIVPSGSVSKFCCIVMMLVGSAVFGALITACSFVLQRLLNNETEARISDLVRFMKKRAVPQKLQRRVKANLRRHLDYEDTVAMSPKLLASLSPGMQRELCLAMLSETMNTFPLFTDVQQSFAAELAQAFYFEQVLPGDVVTPEGHAVQEVIFVQDGRLLAFVCEGYKGLDIAQSSVPPEFLDMLNRRSQLSVCGASQSPGAKTSCRSSAGEIFGDTEIAIHAGTWFGEASLFEEARVYTAVIAASCKSEIAILPAHEYLRIVQNYPRLLDRHNSIREGVSKGEINLAGLKCRSMGRSQTQVLRMHGKMSWFDKIHMRFEYDVLGFPRRTFERLFMRSESEVADFNPVVITPPQASVGASPTPSQD